MGTMMEVIWMKRMELRPQKGHVNRIVKLEGFVTGKNVSNKSWETLEVVENYNELVMFTLSGVAEWNNCGGKI